MESERSRASLDDAFGPKDGARLVIMLPNVSSLLDDMSQLMEDCMMVQGSEWLQKVLERTVEFFLLADAAVITLYDEKTGFDEVVANYVRDKRVYMDIHLRSSEGSTNWCYTNKKPCIWDSPGPISFADDENMYSLREMLIEQQKPDFLNSSLLCCPLMADDKVLGVIQLEHYDDGQHFTEMELHLLASFVATPLARALQRNGLYDSIWKQTEYRNGLFEHAIFRRDDARGKVIGQLNDRITQTLAGVRIALGNLENARAFDPARIRQYVSEVRSDVDRALDEVRKLTSLYGPARSSDGLVGSLEAVLESRVALEGIAVHLDADVDEDDFDDDIVETFCRIAQHALQNTVQHSGAENVYVYLTEYDDMLTMTITDDGCGFSKEELSKKKKPCYGLQSMSQRLFRVNGSLAISSELGSGTKITAIAPLSPTESKK